MCVCRSGEVDVYLQRLLSEWRRPLPALPTHRPHSVRGAFPASRSRQREMRRRRREGGKTRGRRLAIPQACSRALRSVVAAAVGGKWHVRRAGRSALRVWWRSEDPADYDTCGARTSDTDGISLRDCGCGRSASNQQRDTMGGILQKMLQAFYTKKLEVVLVGLENRCDDCGCGCERVMVAPSLAHSLTVSSLNTTPQWQDDAAERDGHGPPGGDVPDHRAERQAREEGRRADEVLGHRRPGAVPQ